MPLSRWNWLNTLTRRLNAGFSNCPHTRRQSLYHRAGPVEALEHRLVLTNPNADPGGPYFIRSGDTLNLDGSMSQTSDPSDATLNLSYFWAVNGVNVPTPAGSMPSISWDTLSAPTTLPIFPGYGLAKGAVDNVYTIYLGVQESASSSDSDVTTVTVYANEPPTANAGGPYSMTGGIGNSITLDGSMSSDLDDMFPNYSWDIEPFGSIDYTGNSKTLTWEDLYALGFRGGTSKQVKLIVNDGLASDDDVTTITVVNSGPTADAGPAFSPETEYVIEFGDALTLDASNSSDEDQGPVDPVTYDWDIDNDGTYDETGETVTISWADLSTIYNYSAGNHTVKLKVSDSDTPKDGTDTVTVRVKPPMVSVSITSNMREHSSSPTHGTITLTRTGSPAAALQNVTIAISGSAIMAPATNADFANIATTVDFATGSPTKTLQVTILDDGIVEGSENISVTITGGSATTYDFDMTNSTASGTIEDMDKWRWKDLPSTYAPISTNETHAPTTGIWAGSSLTFSGSVSATNNSVSASMQGDFDEQGSMIPGVDGMYHVEDSWNFVFDFDPVSGAISISTGPTTLTSSASQQHGDLEGACPYALAYSTDNRQVTVTVDRIGVIAGGDADVSAGIAGFTAVRSWAKDLLLTSVFIVTLKVEQYEQAP